MLGRFRRGVQNHLARVRVDDGGVARARGAVKVAKADDRGDAEAPRDDGRVRSPAAHVRRDGLNVREVEFGDGRGHQLLRDDDGVLRQTATAHALAGERPEPAARHVLYGGASLAQVVVLDLLVDCEHAVGDDLDGPLAVHALRAYDGLHVVVELAVFEHQEVRVEDVRVLFAERARGALLQGEKLSAREAHRGAVATHLALDLPGVERDAVDAVARAAVDAQHAPRRHAVRDGDAAPALLTLLPLHAHSPASPNPLEINWHRASSASRSSAPSAVIINSVPREAASISTLRIDLASADALRSARMRRSADTNAVAVRTSFAAARACRPKRFTIVTPHSTNFSPCALRPRATRPRGKSPAAPARERAARSLRATRCPAASRA